MDGGLGEADWACELVGTGVALGGLLVGELEHGVELGVEDVGEGEGWGLGGGFAVDCEG